MKTKVEFVKGYFSLLESFSESKADFDEVLHPEFEQTELPNLLNKSGQKSDLTDTVRRAALGKKILAEQFFSITNFVESADQIVVEALWQGIMAIDAGPLKAKQRMKAHFCIVCEFKDGKIFRQRNYDCFEPFT